MNAAVAVVSGRGGAVALRWGWLNWPAGARRAAALAYFALVNWLVFAPARSFGPALDLFPHQDKAVHGAIFAGLALALRWALPGAAQGGRPLAAAAAALAAYAGAAEALQPLLGGAGRTFEWADLAGNLAGSAAGWLAFGRLRGGDESAPGRDNRATPPDRPRPGAAGEDAPR